MLPTLARRKVRYGQNYAWLNNGRKHPGKNVGMTATSWMNVNTSATIPRNQSVFCSKHNLAQIRITYRVKKTATTMKVKFLFSLSVISLYFFQPLSFFRFHSTTLSTLFEVFVFCFNPSNFKTIGR